MSAHAEKQVGYHSDELMAERAETIVHDGLAETPTADKRRVQPEVQWTGSGSGVELVGRRKDKSQLSMDVVPKPMESGQAIPVTATLRDISSTIEPEEPLDLFQKAEAAERLNGTVAHDPNNAFAVIMASMRSTAPVSEWASARRLLSGWEEGYGFRR